MSSNEGYVDQSTALFYEIAAQLEDFQPARFREFYHNYFGRGDSRLAKFLGVDFATANYGYTGPSCGLEIGLFGLPHDELLTQTGQLTGSALKAMESVGHFFKKIASYGSTSEIPHLRPNFPIKGVSVTLFIGRRSLGPERYENFTTQALSFVAPERHENLTTRAKNLVAGLSSVRPSRLRLTVRSFDTIVDEATLRVLEPFPFRNQDLLKTILDTGGEAVRGKALDRLDRTQETGPIFETFLQVGGPIKSAVAGARDVQKLKALLAQLGNNEWLANFVRTRISILENDLEAVEAVASSPTTYDSVYQALEAINDEASLERIRNRFIGDTPRDISSRLIIAAKLAARAGDAEKVDEAIQQTRNSYSDDELKRILMRIKLQLEVEQKTAPEVFISYRHESVEHREWVRKLAEDLRQNGINVLLDQWELHLGDSIGDFGAAAIFRAKAMLFLITPSSVEAVEADERSRSVVKFEFQLANARRYKDGDFRIIGILRSGERPPNHLADTLYVDFRQKENYEVQLRRLIKDLRGESDRPGLGPAK